MMSEKTKKIVIAVAILTTFSLGFTFSSLLSPNNSSEQFLKEQLKQKDLEIDGVKVELEQAKKEIKSRIEEHQEFDSVRAKLQKDLEISQLQVEQERAKRRKLFESMTRSEKEQLLIKRYEKPPR